MSRLMRAISLAALSIAWLAVVIPGTAGESGVYWEALILYGLLPVAVLWGVFLFRASKKRPDDSGKGS